MSDPIKLALNTIFQLYVAVFIVFTWFSLAKFVAAETTEHTKLFPEQNEGKWTREFVYFFQYT